MGLIGLLNQKDPKITCVGYVCRSHDPSDLLHGLEIRTKAAMATKYLLIDNGGNG